MGIVSFELFHINCMALSRNFRKVRVEAVQKVVKNSNRYRNFVAGSFYKYVLNLLTDRKLVDNAAIQATSNAFRISIEILNDSERIPSYIVYHSTKILLCLLLRLKSRTARGVSHHPVFMGNCRAISHTCYLPSG